MALGRIRSLTQKLGAVDRKVSPWVTGATVAESVRNPLTAGPWMLLGLAGGASLAGAGYQAATGKEDVEKVRTMIDMRLRLERERRVLEMERQRKQMQEQMALQILSTQAPDVYNRVLAGRPLPRGAEVLGGRPRRDLLNELVQAMSNGTLAQPTM